MIWSRYACNSHQIYNTMLTLFQNTLWSRPSHRCEIVIRINHISQEIRLTRAKQDVQEAQLKQLDTCKKALTMQTNPNMIARYTSSSICC